MTPCKDCKDRFIGCHSTCNKYTEWQDERLVEKRKISEMKFKENMAGAFLIKRREKRKRERNLRGQK